VQSNPHNRFDAVHAPGQRHSALREQGDDHAERGDFGGAERCYAEASRLTPEEPGPYVGLATVYLQTGRLREAESTFRIAQRLRPNCAEALGGLAMVYQARRAYPSAFEMYLKCLELDSDNLVALLGLFQTSCRMGSFAMITQYLERYLRSHPGDTSVLFCLATLYARDNKLRQAREVLAELLRLQPQNAQWARLLASVEDLLAAEASKEANT